MDLKTTKICHFTSVHTIDDVRIFAKQCTSLAKNGYDVSLIACGKEFYTDKKNGVNRIQLSVKERNRLWRIFKATRLIYRKALKINADIYHFHDPELLPTGLKLKRKGKKVIFDSHEFYGEQLREKEYIPLFLRNVIARLYMIYESYVCRRIDAVVQVCTLEGKNYFCGRSKKSLNIANYPSIDELEFKNEKSKSHFAHIGSLTYNRGIFHIVKAAAYAKIPLVLGGKFHSASFHQRLKSMEEYHIVQYNGVLNRNQVNDVLSRSYAGLSTLLNIGQYSKIDTLPTKVYEYMAAGIPVIVSNTRYAKEIVEKYKIGICVDPENIMEITQSMLFLKNNPAAAIEMGKNGRLAFENEFNWKMEERKLVKLYQSLCPIK